MKNQIVAFREIAADGTPITDWIDGSLPANTPPLHPGATIQFAYAHPLPAVAQPVADERAGLALYEVRAHTFMQPNVWKEVVKAEYDRTPAAHRRIVYARAALCPPAEEVQPAAMTTQPEGGLE